ASARALRELAPRIVDEERTVVLLEHLVERGVLDPLEQAARDRGPCRGGLADDAASLHVDRDVESAPLLADHEERLLDLLADDLGLEDLEGSVVDPDAARALADRRSRDGLLALAGGLDDDGGLHRRAPRRRVTSSRVRGARRDGRERATSMDWRGAEAATA